MDQRGCGRFFYDKWAACRESSRQLLAGVDHSVVQAVDIEVNESASNFVDIAFGTFCPDGRELRRRYLAVPDEVKIDELYRRIRQTVGIESFMRIVEIRFDLGEVQGIGANKDRDGVLLPMIPEIGLALENQRSILITILGEAINASPTFCP